MDDLEPTGVIEAEPQMTQMEPPSVPPKSTRKIWLVVFVTLFLLGIVAGVLRLVLCMNQASHLLVEGEDADIDGRDDIPGLNSEEINSEIIELSVNDELVQKVYRNFDHVSFPDANRFSFYTNENSMAGNPDREQMLHIAKDNTVTRFCKGDYYDQGQIRWSDCYSGSEIAQKIEEIFGQKLSFSEDDFFETRGGCGWIYDSQHDEFHQQGSGCGRADPRRVARNLYAAAKDAERVYLYELAIYIEETMVYHIGEETMAGEPIGKLSDLDIELNAQGAVLQGDVESYKELLDQDKFKWTFVWNGENYIYESLKKN